MQNTLCGIYKITNKANNKFYIGKSFNLANRLKDHIKALQKNKHHNYKLQHDFNIHNIKNFKFEILELCYSIEQLDEKEYQYLQKECKGNDLTYNIIFDKQISENDTDIYFDVFDQSKSIQHLNEICDKYNNLLLKWEELVINCKVYEKLTEIFKKNEYYLDDKYFKILEDYEIKLRDKYLYKHDRIENEIYKKHMEVFNG